MKIYRGQNNKVESFAITAGNSNLMSEYGPGLYFFNFTHRKRALVYSLDNAALLCDDASEDEPEQLDSGYFYQCSIDQDELRTLDKISPDEIGDISSFVENLLDHIEYDTNFMRHFAGNSLEEKYDNAIESLSECDSVYQMIKEIHGLLQPSCNREFCAAISIGLKELNSFVAIADDRLGELVVYDPSLINITAVLEVTPDDLKNSFEERMALVRGIEC